LLSFNLQRFAGEKTERATPQRRREAREKGQVPKSIDLTSAVTLLAVIVVLKLVGSYIWNQWTDIMQEQLSSLRNHPLTVTDVQGLFTHQVLVVAELLAPILGAALLIGIAVSAMQTGPMFLPNRIMPDFSRVQPFQGLKRIFSMRTGIEATKSILKLVVVGVLSYIYIQSVMMRVESLVAVDLVSLVSTVGSMVWQLAVEVSILMLMLAVLDLLFQRFEFEKSIRMSREEIKEELKRMEGNPQVKAKIQQRGRELAMRRMMQEVPKADVVITNPTHFAVALLYDAKVNSAPVVVAKGQDDVALRIKRIAAESNVPTVENKPLAQTLFKTVDIGQAIPAELYQAVAEVLAYVYRMKDKQLRG
jgi:flagellar biosynthesis protein FlhB